MTNYSKPFLNEPDTETKMAEIEVKGFTAGSPEKKEATPSEPGLA